MVSDKALYWMALVVLALVAGNSLATRHGDWIGCLGQHSLQVAQRITDGAISAVDRGGSLYDRTGDRISRGQMVAVRLQTRLASMQTRMARRQAIVARLQAEKVRMISLTAMKRGMTCVQEDVTVDVPAPEVNVQDDLQ